MKQFIITLLFLLSTVYAKENTIDNNIVPIIMALDGIAIATMWTVDIHKNKLLEDGFFRSKENEKLFWPHLLAEYGTAAGLIISAYGLYNNEDWANSASLFTLGALTYTSLSSMSWSLANKERYIYVTPMLLSLTGAGVCISVLF